MGTFLSFCLQMLAWFPDNFFFLIHIRKVTIPLLNIQKNVCAILFCLSLMIVGIFFSFYSKSCFCVPLIKTLLRSKSNHHKAWELLLWTPCFPPCLFPIMFEKHKFLQGIMKGNKHEDEVEGIQVICVFTENW